MSNDDEIEPLNRFVSEHNQRLVMARMFGARAEGSHLGRYVLHEIVGKGGMGVVFAGHDPNLDRKVAIKLLRSAGTPSARARFVREAQAMAKLSHANVISVFEVGEVEREVGEPVTFIAMEYVDGVTLSAWLAEQPRTRAEILAVMQRAGRGLEAVHTAGLVHRDFKPDNVMIGADGRVLVTDFGLARELDPGSGEGDSSAKEVIAGTPAYMAPDQLDGRGADAASDQFSFCVALYEALYGERPFVARSLRELSETIRARRVVPGPKDSSVPSWLRKVIVRGLDADPSARWPSMGALLDALSDDPVLRRRKRLLALGGGALLFASAWGLGVRASEQPGACADMAAPLAGIWDEPRRAEVRAALLATELAYAPATWDRVQRRLDDYTQAWVEDRTRACEATQRGEQSDALLDRRVTCLDRRLAHVRATVDILARADASIVNRAVQMVWELPALDRCADVEALLAEVPPPDDPALAERVVTLSDRLAEAEALRKAGEYAEGLARVEEVVAEAEALDYPPLRVRAWLGRGPLRDRNGDFEGARATLELAYTEALAQRMADESALAAANLIWVVGQQLADLEAGRAWAVHAEPLSRAADPASRIVYLNNIGNLTSAAGEYAEAAKLLEQAVDLVEAEHSPEHPLMAYALNNLSNVVAAEGRAEDARVYLERSLALKQRVLGPDHPHVAASLANLGILEAEQGNYAEARAYFEQALAHDERVYGPDNPALATSLANLANLAQLEGAHDEARALFERALAIDEAKLGAEHPNLAYVLKSLGEVALAQGHHAEAAAYLRRALAIREQALGPDHPLVARTLIGLGKLHSDLGELDEARALLERAVAVCERAQAPELPELASALTYLGLVMLDQGRAGEAVSVLDRACTLRESSSVAPTALAQSRFALARALWDAPSDAGRDRERARTLAESARSVYAASQADGSALVGLDAWLDGR